MIQHAGLSPERWRTFPLAQQLIMVGNEMLRSTKLCEPDDAGRRINSLERVLALVDLTIAVNDRAPLRRELLRWREVVAGLYVASEHDASAHRAALRALLLLTPESAKQAEFVAPWPAAVRGN